MAQVVHLIWNNISSFRDSGHNLLSKNMNASKVNTKVSSCKSLRTKKSLKKTRAEICAQCMSKLLKATSSPFRISDTDAAES